MRYSVRAYLFVGLLMLCGLPGCGNSLPPRVMPELPDPDAAHKAMELLDTNHDGVLDAKELEKAPGLKAAISHIDTKHDGKITEQEIDDRIKSWAASGVGRMTIRCHVMHNGKPLEGAKVTLVPESFLGGTLQSGSGTTDKTGAAGISFAHAVDPSIPGLSPGFYRVEITKDGEKIPAKYNTDTILGIEVANDWSSTENSNFQLQY